MTGPWKKGGVGQVDFKDVTWGNIPELVGVGHLFPSIFSGSFDM